MTQKQAIQLFEERKVRTVWDDQTEEWYFSIVDVVGVLTDSVNPTDYIKKMKKRDPELSKGWGQIVTPLSVQTAGGRQRVNCATTQGMFRIIQSIPSPKAEPFKQWMAQVAADRLDQMQDPELSIQQAMVDYKRLGYSDNWINQRLKAIEVRKDLTDAWKLYAGATWTRWSRLKDITVKNEGVSGATGGALAPGLVSTIKEDQNWHDTWAYAVGTSYQLTKQVVLRTGLTFDQSPTNNTDRSPRIPTGDRTIFSLGLGYQVMDNMTIDLAYSYLKEEDVKISRSNQLASYNAKYENSANGFGLGMTYKF